MDILKDRARMFHKARTFFAERGVLEVDCPALSRAAPIDLHIDVMQVSVTSREVGYLHTSPEYAMKRLLAEGLNGSLGQSLGDIYQLGHVFRQEEVSPLHNPEFTMAEWYRMHLSFFDLIEETLDFSRLFLGQLPSTTHSYREICRTFLKIDPLITSKEQLLSLCDAREIALSDSLRETTDVDTLLQLLIAHLIEPNLGKEELSVIWGFPPSQAALSEVTKDQEGAIVALRFELYYQGIELANGYQELTDPKEQRIRLLAAQEARKKIGKDPLPLDEEFLAALEKGIPRCCGVAVGFDRLMQLRHNCTTLQEVLPFSW